MWVLAKDLPDEIQVVLQDLRDTKFYKVYGMRNRYIGNAKIYDIESNFLKQDHKWIKR